MFAKHLGPVKDFHLKAGGEVSRNSVESQTAYRGIWLNTVFERGCLVGRGLDKGHYMNGLQREKLTPQRLLLQLELLRQALALAF